MGKVNGADETVYGNDGSVWRCNLDGPDPVAIDPGAFRFDSRKDAAAAGLRVNAPF